MKLFECLCPCFTSKSNQNPQPPQSSPTINANSVARESEAPIPINSKNENLIIETRFRQEDLSFSDFTPASTQKMTLPYNCPICMRYFSTILVLKCCKQYICHYCISSLAENHTFEVACPHCKCIPIHAIDVEVGSSVRKYSDSPYNTLRASNKLGNKWVPMPVVHEDKDYEESQPVYESFQISNLSPVVSSMRFTV
jgi:hypothetical protein